jgi:hypothetical protein
MARHTGISLRSVQRIWAAHDLQPHRLRTFKRSTDPEFAAKLEDIVGLYVDPPKHAVVLSVDEKSQIQALDRTQPGLPLKPGKAGTMIHDYLRVAPHCIVAAGIAETAQFLEQPHQRQPFPARPCRIRCQKPFQLLPPRPQLRLRLHPPLVDERGLARADHLPHDLPRHLQLSADRLDGLALHDVPATYLRDRLHDQHPEPGSHDHGSTLGPDADGVPIGR